MLRSVTFSPCTATFSTGSQSSQCCYAIWAAEPSPEPRRLICDQGLGFIEAEVFAGITHVFGRGLLRLGLTGICRFRLVPA